MEQQGLTAAIDLLQKPNTGKRNSPDRGGPEEIICFSSKEQFEQAMETRLRSWQTHTDASSYFIGLDGLPGSGKSTLAGIFEELSARIGFQLYIIPVDNFIQTDRESRMRKEMTQDPEVFWRLYYSQSAVMAVLEGIKKHNGNEFQMDLPKVYNRKTGRTGPGIVSVPGGRKVVLLEGVNSTKMIDDLQAEHDVPSLKVLVYAHPENALNRAVNRDTQNKRRTPQESMELRSAEYKHLVPVIHGLNAHKADIIYLQP